MFSKVINLYDSTGVQKIKNGNGFYTSTGKTSSEEGNYLDGFKEGLWKGTSGEQRYEENYKAGKLISGVAYLADGKQINYTVPEEMPVFPGGIADFYKYLSRSIRYPAEAQRNRITGKTFVSFVVEKDGALTEFVFKNDLGYGTQSEILRVLQQSPKWNLGRQQGIPVRVKYNINVNLALN